MKVRRYYLLKRIAAREQDDGLEPFWHGKQLAEPGNALPVDFPLLTELECAGYVAIEDLDGASECELIDAGLEPAAARRVYEAFFQLTAT